MSPEAPAALPVGHALILGVLHGPAELLPVSSSAHVALVPALLGWPATALPGDVEKAFAVALHAGTLVGLVALVPRPSLTVAVVSTLPAALAGLALEDVVEQRLGGRRATAAGLVAGSALLVAADAVARRSPAAHRRAADAGVRDALVVGAAQALALAPGISRLGAAVAAARLRGFSRPEAFALGRSIGLPVTLGATALKALRLVQRGLAPELRAPFAAGAVAALASTLAAAPLRRVSAVRLVAAERCALAALALARGPRAPSGARR
jgi:undecaprenyl-diphosphatase